MAVTAVFGNVQYKNIAGFLLQAKLTPLSGLESAGNCMLRAFIFLMHNVGERMEKSPCFQDEGDLTITGDGSDINFPGITYRSETITYHNQVAVKCLEFRFTDPKKILDATANIKMAPVAVAAEGGNSLASMQYNDGGVHSCVIGQQQRKFDGGATIVRVMCESQSGENGGLGQLLKQNQKIHEDGEAFDLAFSLNGQCIDYNDMGFEFIEYEERFGIANFCPLTPLASVETAGVGDFSMPEINEIFASDVVTFIKSLAGNVPNPLQAGFQFTEVLTFKSMQAAARNMDYSPPKWAEG